MEGLRSILRTAHCRSTHHLFALDALQHVRSRPGQQLARMLLRYHPRYLSGAIEPDTRFRDFHNHVVHVADDNWGGAPQSAQHWYDRLQRLLRQRQWSDAAHAAGVLSHYFTDPLQPLHTAHSPRQAIVHLPLEWSVSQSYDAILARWRADSFRIVFQLSTRPDWLPSAILHGAALAHRSFETLVETYDLEAARRDPRRGLSEAAREAIAELFGVAITGWARVLDRTAEEAAEHLPHVSLAWTLLLAALNAPYRRAVGHRESLQRRASALAALDHYHRTGELGPHLPEEIRVVQQAIAMRDGAPMRERDSDDPYTVPLTPRSAPESPLVDVVAVGRKTAQRLNAVGIRSVAQLLSSSPEELVRRLQRRWPQHVRWITVETIADWQAQARLVTASPGLRSRDAQWLVAAGCRTAAALASADVEHLTAKLNRYAKTPAGKLLLRQSPPPSRQDIQRWSSAVVDISRRAA